MADGGTRQPRFFTDLRPALFDPLHQTASPSYLRHLTAFCFFLSIVFCSPLMQLNVQSHPKLPLLQMFPIYLDHSPISGTVMLLPPSGHFTQDDFLHGYHFQVAKLHVCHIVWRTNTCALRFGVRRAGSCDGQEAPTRCVHLSKCTLWRPHILFILLPTPKRCSWRESLKDRVALVSPSFFLPPSPPPPTHLSIASSTSRGFLSLPPSCKQLQPSSGYRRQTPGQNRGKGNKGNFIQFVPEATQHLLGVFL